MAFAKFMNKKDFHPGSKWNIKKVWMAEQKITADKAKQQDLEYQYKKEQERYHNRTLVTKDEKLKSGLGFMYEAPPGYDKDKKPKEEEEEPRFEWQKGAPKEAYAKDLNLATRSQPFGIPVRNVRCIRCGKWGHVNTDRECPMLSKSSVGNYDPTTFADVADPAKLMDDMRSDGLALKQSVLGRSFNPNDPNQQIVASEDEEDPEAEFLASLTDKQKRKLLRKLDKLERQEQEAEETKKHKKKRKKKTRVQESDSSESDGNGRYSWKKKKRRHRSHSSEDSDSGSRKKSGSSRKHDKKREYPESDSEDERQRRHRKREKTGKREKLDNKRKDSVSDSEENEKSSSSRKRDRREKHRDRKEDYKERKEGRNEEDRKSRQRKR